MTHSAFEVVRNESDKPLVIRDVGGPTQRTVTNDAENVVKHLHEHGLLQHGRRLFYYDSDGDPGELIHHNGEFKDYGGVTKEELQ